MRKFAFTPLEAIGKRERDRMSLTGFMIVILIIIILGISKSAVSFSPRERSFLIEEKIILKNISKDIGNLRVWVPYPVSDNWQAIDDFKLTAPFKADVIMDKEYGNRILIFKSKKDATYNMPLQITLSYITKRREYGASGDLEASSKNLPRFLKADRLVPVNGEIKKLAGEITQGKNNDLEKARAIYDYLIDELTYSKDDPKVCGIGDSLLTLQYLKGICTDYHSLFISLVRSLGIPAKFEIGFPIPADKEEGRINGYHCWAKFYIKGEGWIPVDISEADKHPEKKDYFFGHIDENRVHFTTGRDLRVKYAKDENTLPLNFFIYPYVELNGKQVKIIDFEISFKEFKGGDKYGKLLRFREGKAGKI